MPKSECGKSSRKGRCVGKGNPNRHITVQSEIPSSHASKQRQGSWVEKEEGQEGHMPGARCSLCVWEGGRQGREGSRSRVVQVACRVVGGRQCLMTREDTLINKAHTYTSQCERTQVGGQVLHAKSAKAKVI